MSDLRKTGRNVRHRLTKATGTTAGFPLRPPLVSVRWNDRWDVTAAPEYDLEDLGPEDPQPDFRKCGAGQGRKCCLFLTAGPSGPECERHGSLRTILLIRRPSMNAQRVPVRPAPDCQDVDDDADIPQNPEE